MNLIYLGYNLKRTNYKQLYKWVLKCSEIKQKRKSSVYIDLLKYLFKYNCFLSDYFYMRFYDLNSEDNILDYTNRWDLHLFHKKYNSKNAILLRNKIKFREHFKEFCDYPYFIANKNNLQSFISWIINENITKVVCKDPFGTTGQGVRIFKVIKKNNDLYLDDVIINEKYPKLVSQGFLLMEKFINQNVILSEISPTSVNTIRIVTFVNEDNNVEFWGAALRLSVNNNVDNFSAGGLSAMVDLKSGLITKAAVSRNPFDNNKYEIHPITKKEILNVQLPFWTETIEMIKLAALKLKDVRTVGWDIAMTENGPTIIEGNDNWGRYTLELTTGKGIGKLIRERL